jgi:hypothetical protein
MSIAALIRQMAELGAPAEAIALAVEAIEAVEAKDAARRAKRAEQKRKERQARDDDATVARHDGDKEATPSPQVFPQTPYPNPNPDIPSKRNPKGFPKGSPFEALSAVLSPETASAVVEHRQRIRKPLTFRAAELLAGKFQACPDPNAAADAMIANGWQGFEPDWLNRSQGPPRAKDYTQAAAEIIEDMRNVERAKSQGPIGDVQFLSGVSGRFEAEVEYLPPPSVRIVGRSGD